MSHANSSKKRAAPSLTSQKKRRPDPEFWDYEARAVLAPLAKGLEFPWTVLEGRGRHYLPIIVQDFLQVGGFLAQVVPAALAAQRAYRVPSSFLIAKSLYETGGSASDLYEPSKGRRSNEDDIHFRFMDEACDIAKSSRYKTAMKLTADPVAFAKRLCELGLYDDSDLAEILDRMDQFNLAQCDLAVGPNGFPPRDDDVIFVRTIVPEGTIAVVPDR